MSTIKEIEQEIVQVQSLKTLVEMYGEIASIRMMKTRDNVLKNRRYLGAINDIFKDALAAYAAKLSALIRSGKLKKGGKVTFLAHNGKKVAVFISANTGFYGQVVKDVFNKFINDVSNQDVEITIIGRLGRSLFVERMPNTPYTYFDLLDYGIDQTKLGDVIRHLVPYEEIRVYFGEYKTVVNQEPKMLSITAGAPVTGEVVQSEDFFIFEPSVEKILMFFETEIFASLFDQSIRESQLAKFASRILAMDKAAENIRQDIKNLSLERLRVFHKQSDRKQVNSMSSVMYSDIV